VIEEVVLNSYEIDQATREAIVAEVGNAAGWHPALEDYDVLPEPPTTLDPPQVYDLVDDYLASHERIHPDPTELARIKANLRTLYEAGPGAKTDDADLEELEHQGDEDEVVSGAYIPIPTETFLEELSVKLQIHPISVYWLLEELRAEGVRCKPEERRLLEDRLSVLVLRLLGHRWPRQLEAGEPVPPWADQDGIIPLTPGTGEATVAERLRERLRAEDGPLGAQRVEALLEELTGQTLEVWLRKTFFERHTRQFKRRPIAWQLVSTPVAGAKGKGGKKGKREPAFECLLYYHACGGDVLARVRTQYVEPLLIAERRRVEQARKGGDDSEAALATARIHELGDFAQRLRQVEENGFACAALDDLLAGEPLDRWSGDGVFPPADREALFTQERAWRVDINDGVRVNVAPLQAVGLLAGDVLNKKDLPKASADRARWRSDERRWVRAGKLPRCGWMDESIPESPDWTDLAPEREAERARLEEKRKVALGQTSASISSR
jgi:hypothetical protein